MANENLFKALAKAQGLIEGAKKRNLNPHFKSKYADLAAVWDACREELSANGLSVIQFPTSAPANSVGLMTILAHESGESISNEFTMPLKDPSNPQAVGSALTYMRRYALMGAVGIAPEDDDANAAKGQGVAAAKGVSPTTDWSAVIKDTMAQLKVTSDDTEKRRLYATVRNSVMDEPFKTQLLSEMSETIKAGLAQDAKKKK